MAGEKIGEEMVKEGAPKVTDEQVEKVVVKSEEIQKKFRAGGPLRRFVEDGRLLASIVRDYRSGKYRQVPYATIAAIVFALIYVLNPLDLVPDFLPVIGQVDDAAVVAGCLILVEADLRKYGEWKQGQDQTR